MAILLNFETAITGDSNVEKHEEWITLDSVSFNVARTINASGGGKSREVSNPMFGEVQCMKSTDMTSPEIMFQAIQGKTLGAAELHWVQTGAEGTTQVYYTVKLGNAIVSSYDISSGGDRPSESFAVSFDEIITQFDDFDGDAVATGTPKGWNLINSKQT